MMEQRRPENTVLGNLFMTAYSRKTSDNALVFGIRSMENRRKANPLRSAFEMVSREDICLVIKTGTGMFSRPMKKLFYSTTKLYRV